MTTTGRYRFRGVNRNGGSVTGSITIPDGRLPAWVQQKYEGRWRWLEVDDTSGERVAEIGHNDDTGRRIWWAVN